jgi:TRAP-type C4-dicarboxylate transport system permease small subunit
MQGLAIRDPCSAQSKLGAQLQQDLRLAALVERLPRRAAKACALFNTRSSSVKVMFRFMECLFSAYTWCVERHHHAPTPPV